MEVSGQLHVLAALPPGKEPLVSIGWVGPRAVLEAVVKRKIPSPRHELSTYGGFIDYENAFDRLGQSFGYNG
jgi:hypothetical protein